MKTEFDFEISVPFEYANKGEQATAQFITFKAPTSKHMQHCAFLKQAFFRALPDTQSTDKVEDDGKEAREPTGAEIMQLILISPHVELVNVLIAAKELFTSKDIALVDGEVQLTKPLVDAMSQDDLEDCMGEYLANFILASALRKMSKK
jgi:hypothetical protein